MAQKNNTRISVLGDGGWGTTLAILLSKKKYKITLWGAFKDYINYLDKKRVNSRFLPEITIPRNINITPDLRKAVSNQDIIILAIPSEHMRAVLKKVKKCGSDKKAIYVNVAKGIELNSLKRMSEVIKDELGNVKIGVLSGPTIAHELALGIPTTAVVSSASRETRTFLQNVFMTNRFRIYTNSDVVGMELGGSLKNVIAIACGIADGLKFGTNAKAAILTRGLSEISRLGSAMGAKKTTFSGLSGLGDLVTTCISPYSRNRSIGEQIAKGKKITYIKKHMRMVAEGVPTTKSAYLLSIKYKVDMPITKQVYQVIYKNKSPLKAVEELMTRKKKEE